MDKNRQKTVEESRLSANKTVYKTNRYLRAVEEAENFAAKLADNNHEIQET